MGCQPLVTVPAWLLPLCSAFVTFEADSPPPPTLQFSRLPACHLLILFSGSRWPELSRVEYTPSFHHQYSLQQTTHVGELWDAQFLVRSGIVSQLSGNDP